MEPFWLLWQLTVSAALAGLCWTVQLAIYPQFGRLLDEAGVDRFRAYHADYTRGMGFVAAPLMVAELGLSIGWLMESPHDWSARIAAVLTVVLWGWTFLVMVPLHNRLQAAPDGRDAARLVAGNVVRTAVWTLRTGILVLALRPLLSSR